MSIRRVRVRPVGLRGRVRVRIVAARAFDRGTADGLRRVLDVVPVVERGDAVLTGGDGRPVDRFREQGVYVARRRAVAVVAAEAEAFLLFGVGRGRGGYRGRGQQRHLQRTVALVVAVAAGGAHALVRGGRPVVRHVGWSEPVRERGTAGQRRAIGVVTGGAEGLELGRDAGVGGRRPGVRVLQVHGAALVRALVVAGLAVRVRDRVGSRESGQRPVHVVALAVELGDYRAPRTLRRAVAAGAPATGSREPAVVVVAGPAVGTRLVPADAAVPAVLGGRRVAHLADPVVRGVAVRERVRAAVGRELDRPVARVRRGTDLRNQREVVRSEVAARFSLVVVAVPAARRAGVPGSVVDPLLPRDRGRDSVHRVLRRSGLGVAGQAEVLCRRICGQLRVSAAVQVVAGVAVVVLRLGLGRHLRGGDQPEDEGRAQAGDHRPGHRARAHGAPPVNTSTDPDW